MEPLIISRSSNNFLELVGMASDLVESSSRLEGLVAKETATELGRLVSGMNCYYSNKIEGTNTKSLDIERALLGKVDQPDNTRLRGLAFAHIQAGQWARSHIAEIFDGGIFRFAKNVHKIFYQHLPESDAGNVAPGEIRLIDVAVGNHVAPSFVGLNDFLSRFDSVYGQQLTRSTKGGIYRLEAIISTMAAHHRFVWIHPFEDGNGRVARILLDSMLNACGINRHGLWSLSRGLAKTSKQYKSFLEMADSPRQGDLDGRGNLSEKMLCNLIKYELEVARDQSEFMGHMFSLENLEARARGYFHRVRTDLPVGAVDLYVHALKSGVFERMRAGPITGLSERSARDILGSLVREGFLVSDSPKGLVRAGFPMKSLGSLLPDLYPAGEVTFAEVGYSA
ncbi:MAG: Fic family protein [Ferrovum myxofaciens]|uniref:Fic family protein n=1 Tax=Ferrovum myxofaciens TaxID=416213 RepID=UPI0023528ECE|nr:Fic family protein [Ferrovum myxofaciens]QKE41716.1 MAG: Fic family protein [Ferrovum myxofaciens]